MKSRKPQSRYHRESAVLVLGLGLRVLDGRMKGRGEAETVEVWEQFSQSVGSW